MASRLRLYSPALIRQASRRRYFIQPPTAGRRPLRGIIQRWVHLLSINIAPVRPGLFYCGIAELARRMILVHEIVGSTPTPAANC